MPHMAKKICLITGTTNGIGQATALELARMGATVVTVARDPQRGEAAVTELRRLSENESADLICCDLASLHQVRQLAETFKKRYQQLHVLIHNAGVLFPPAETSHDGLDTTFVVNHLAPFLLTQLLLDVLKASTPARIVTVASSSHRLGKINFARLQGKKAQPTFFPGWRAYNQSKLANILFTYELSRRLQGTGVTANCLHPGMVATNVAAGADGIFTGVINRYRPLLVRLFLKLPHTFLLTPEQGAKTTVYLAASKDLEKLSGKYFVKKKDVNSSKRSHNRTLARQLWEMDLKLIGLNASQVKGIASRDNTQWSEKGCHLPE